MNMQSLMKQAQNLQKEMMKTKDEIDAMEFEAESSLVKVKVNGKKEVLKVTIKADDSFESDDLEMLEDMIQVAVNEALAKVDKVTEQKMGKYTSSMPGLF